MGIRSLDDCRDSEWTAEEIAWAKKVTALTGDTTEAVLAEWQARLLEGHGTLEQIARAESRRRGGLKVVDRDWAVARNLIKGWANVK